MDRPAPARYAIPRQQDSRPLEHLTPQERAVPSVPTAATRPDEVDLEQLSDQERAIYRVLADNRGRVVSRTELARAVGITELHERRCDSLLVGVRRVVGTDRVRTVRRRGWMLVP